MSGKVKGTQTNDAAWQDEQITNAEHAAEAPSVPQLSTGAAAADQRRATGTGDKDGMTLKESEIEQHLIDKLGELKYTDRPEIRDKAALERNFRAKFEALNHVQLTDAEFARLRDDIITVMQLFIVSNRDQTYYFANNCRGE